MDLGIAMGFIAAVSGLAWIAGRRLSLSVYRYRPLLLALCLALSLLFANYFFDRLLWAVALPFAAAICWANFLPVILSFTAGLASEVLAIRKTWRLASSSGLLLLAASFLLIPVARPWVAPIDLANRTLWEDGVCLQSHEASCGPAATATLLYHTGHLGRSTAGSEQALSNACLTSQQGTTALGLYRGLQVSVGASGDSARVASRDPDQWLRLGQLPNVSVVFFTDAINQNPSPRFLGADGEGHALVVHSRTKDGRWKIADPATGWQIWTDEEFRHVFTGDSIYIRRR